MGIWSGCTNGSDAGVMDSVQAGSSSSATLTSFHIANNQAALTQGTRDWLARQTGGASGSNQTQEAYNSRSSGGSGGNFFISWVTPPTDIANALLYIPRISNGIPELHQWAAPNPRYPITLQPNEIVSLETSDATARPYTVTMNLSRVDYEKSSVVGTPIRGRRARDAGYMGFYGQSAQSIAALTGRPAGGTQFFSVCNRVDSSAWQGTQIPWNLNLYGAAVAIKPHFLATLGVGA